MHKDWLGNSRISSTIVNHTVVSDQAYAPYGEVYNKLTTGAGVPGQMFTGDTQDILSGLFDTPNRELNASQGRWLSPDPAGAGWNLYAYSTNPNSRIDPTGLDDCMCDYFFSDDGGVGDGSGNDGGGGYYDGVGDPSTNAPGIDWDAVAALPLDVVNAGLQTIYQTVFATPVQLLGNGMDSISQGLCGDSTGACIAMAAPEMSLAAAGSDAAAFFSAASQPTGSSAYVFYSGPGMQAAANDWAVANGGITIEMTQWGQEAQLVEQTYGESSPQATLAWQNASESFQCSKRPNSSVQQSACYAFSQFRLVFQRTDYLGK